MSGSHKQQQQQQDKNNMSMVALLSDDRHHFHHSSYPCSISTCSRSTGSAALSIHFIPVLNSCFPPSINQAAFNIKQAIHLCRHHREVLQSYRDAVIKKHQDSHTAWTGTDEDHKHHNSNNRTVSSSSSSAAASYASYNSSTSQPDDSNDNDRDNVGLLVDDESNGVVGLVDCLSDSVSSKIGLSIGWLIVAGFFSLCVAYTVIGHLIH